MKKTLAQLKAQKFVLTNTLLPGQASFPKVDAGLTADRQLTSSMDETYIFDGRDNPAIKTAYYNAIYKGIAVFEPFHF